MSVKNVSQILSSILPMLDRVKQSIEDSSKSIPKASSQLSNVNRATESATVEILNSLDRIEQRLSTAEASVAAVRKVCTSSSTIGTAIEGPMGVIERAVQDTRQDAMAIAMALQVQDITAQQIAGVTQLIEQVRHHLEGLLQESTDATDAIGASSTLPSQFDGNAQFTNSTGRQENADAIVEQWNKVPHE